MNYYVLLIICATNVALLGMLQERNQTCFDTIQLIMGHRVNDKATSYLQLLPYDVLAILKNLLIAEYSNLFKPHSYPLQGHTEPIRSATLTPDGSWALTGSCDGTARIWDLRDAMNIRSYSFQGHTGWINSVSLSSDGRWALTGSHQAILWDLKDLESIHSYHLKEHIDISSVALTPDGTWAVTGSYDNSARLWNLSDKNDIRSYLIQGESEVTISHLIQGEDRERINAVVLSNDGKCSIALANDCVARFWDLSDPSSIGLHVLQGHCEQITSMSLTPDRQFVLTGSADKTARLWDLRDPSKISTHVVWDVRDFRSACIHVLIGHKSTISSVALTPDARWALTGSWDTTAMLWDLRDTNNICSYILQGHTGLITSVALSPDGRWALTESKDTTMRIWDLRDTNTICSLILEGQSGGITSISVSLDATRVLMISSDPTALLWNLHQLDTLAFQDVLKIIGDEESKRRLQSEKAMLSIPQERVRKGMLSKLLNLRRKRK